MDENDNVKMDFDILLGASAMQQLGMLDDPVQSSDSEYVVPCVGRIGDIRSILEVEVNGMKTTMLFANCFYERNGMKIPVSFANSIAEDQIKLILPNYLNVLKPSREDLYWNISGQNIGEVDLDLKVGYENITAKFCVVRNAEVKMPLMNTSGHLLMGGNGLISQLGMRFRLGERQVLIKKSQYSIPYAGPIGDNGPILLVELNGIKTTMLFLADSESSCIPEDQLKQILPEYKEMIRPSQKMLYYNISDKNIGEVDLELKVGRENILASFCVVGENVNAPLKFPSGGTHGHLLIGGIGLLTKLGMDMGPGEREMTITPKKSQMLLPMDEVREAFVGRNLIEIDVDGKDEVYGIMKFQTEDGKYQVEIHCSTGAVLTILDHPSEGRNRINRGVRSVDTLISILEKIAEDFGAFKTRESDMTLDMEKAREAAIARNWNEINAKENEKDNVLSFQKEDEKWLINIYCTTGAVQTVLKHPTKKINPMNRTVRNMEELIGILDNPRKHTNRNRSNKPKN